MSKTTNDRSEVRQATIELQDLEIPTSDCSQIKGGPHYNTPDGVRLMSPTTDGRRPRVIALETLEMVHHG